MSPQPPEIQAQISKNPGGGRWFAVAVIILLGFSVAWNVSTWPSRLRYPGELGDNVEGMCLAQMVHVRQGVPVYAPASNERFDAMIYGPLYFQLGARVIDPEKPAFFPVRALTLLATLATLVAVGVLTYRISGSLLAIVFAVLFLLSYSLVSNAGVSVRSDMMALAAVFWGVLVAHRYRSGRGIFLAIPFIVVGLFLKQQFLAAPAGIFVYLLLERRWRHAAAFAGITAASGVAMLACLQFVMYPGQSVLLHLVDYNMIAFSWTRFGWGLALYVILLGVPTLLGIEFLRKHPDRLLGVYWACAAVAALVGLAKEGTGTNYYLEVLLINSTLVAALTAQCAREQSRRAELLVLLAVTMLLGLRLTFPLSSNEFATDRAVMNHLETNFRKGTVAAGLGVATGELVRAGFKTPISDFYQYTWLSCRGVIPPDQLLQNFTRRRFEIVAVRLNLNDEKEAHTSNDICLTEDLHRAILDNYVLSATLDLPIYERLEFPAQLYLWVPKPKPSAQGASGTP